MKTQRNKLIKGLLFSLLLMLSSCVLHTASKCSMDLVGQIDAAMVEKVEKTLVAAKGFMACQTIVFEIRSPGGSIFDTLEIVRLMQDAQRSMIVETRGRNLIASGATFLLAAGTPGFRFIQSDTTVMVHGIQTYSGCMSYQDQPVTENALFINHLIDRLAASYMELTGKPLEVTRSWLDCSRSQIGSGQLAVTLGLADRYY